MAQDHVLVCFAISPYKCDNGCCFFAAENVPLPWVSVSMSVVLVLQNGTACTTGFVTTSRVCTGDGGHLEGTLDAG